MYVRVDRVHARRDVDARTRGVRASGISTVAQRGGPRDGVADGETRDWLDGWDGRRAMGDAWTDARRETRCRAPKTRAVCDFPTPSTRDLARRPSSRRRRRVSHRRATTPTDARAMSVAHTSVVRGGVSMGVFMSHDRSNILTHSHDSRLRRRRRIRHTRRDRPPVRARRRDVFAASFHSIVSRLAR